MMAKPSPNPRSARAPYRQRMSGGVLLEGEDVIGRSATASCGSNSYRRTCLTSVKRSETTLGCMTADRAVGDGPNIHARITQTRNRQRYRCPAIQEALAWSVCSCRNIADQVALRRGKRPLIAV